VVKGDGSEWANTNMLNIGYNGNGKLGVSGGGMASCGFSYIGYSTGSTGLVTVDGTDSTWTIDGDGFINMASGGVLAVNGWNGGTPGGFLEIVRGANAIRYWNHAAGEWVGIFTATHGRQYTLTQGTGDLAGYTLLTVTPVAESDISLLAAGGTPNEIKIVLNTPDPENSKIQFSTDLKTWKPIADSPNFVRFDEEGPWNIAAIVTKNPGANEFYRGTTP
jgi:T5SS/PEP-CTERM-associated repeat protein